MLLPGKLPSLFGLPESWEKISVGEGVSGRPLVKVWYKDFSFVFKALSPEYRAKYSQINSCLNQVQKSGFHLLPDFIFPSTTCPLVFYENYFWECMVCVPGKSLNYRRGEDYLFNAFGALGDFHRVLSFIKIEGIPVSDAIIKRKLILADFDIHELNTGFYPNQVEFVKECGSLLLDLVPQLLPLFELVDDSKSVQWCWGDARLANFIFNDRKVSAIIDFEAMGINPIETDFARLMSDFEPWDDSNWKKALDVYSALGLVRVSLAKFFCLTGLVCALIRWVKWFRNPETSIQLIAPQASRANEILEKLNKWKKHGFDTRAF